MLCNIKQRGNIRDDVKNFIMDARFTFRHFLILISAKQQVRMILGCQTKINETQFGQTSCCATENKELTSMGAIAPFDPP